jgi:CheY-like chemotaxis protein
MEEPEAVRPPSLAGRIEKAAVAGVARGHLQIGVLDELHFALCLEANRKEFLCRSVSANLARLHRAVTAHREAVRAVRAAQAERCAPRVSVLLLDTDPQSRSFLRKALRDINAHVREAATAAEAREHFRAGGIDIAIVETNMPSEPGDVLGQEMAAAGVQVILTSGSEYGMARARQAKLPLLRKPYTLKDALRAIVLAWPTR